jgi:hypothetical protein
MTPLHRLVATTAMILSASPLSAQGNDGLARPVAPGDTVRLRENGTVLVQGILLRRDSTGFVVVDRRTRDTVHVPVSQITRAEVRRGSHRRGGRAVGTGAAVGAGIGGVVLGLAIASREKGDEGLAVAIGGFVAVVTTGIGTAIGAIASFTHTETWLLFVPAAVPWQASSAPAPAERYAISTST